MKDKRRGALCYCGKPAVAYCDTCGFECEDDLCGPEETDSQREARWETSDPEPWEMKEWKAWKIRIARDPPRDRPTRRSLQERPKQRGKSE